MKADSPDSSDVSVLSFFTFVEFSYMHNGICPCLLGYLLGTEAVLLLVGNALI